MPGSKGLRQMMGSFGAAPRWLRLAVILGAAALLSGWPGLASGQTSIRNSLNYRLQATGGDQCVQAINRVQGDVLVNHCDECRKAQIQYQRRGGGFPITRDFRVPEKGKVELSFKGSGKTRVVSDTPCDAADSQPTTGEVKDCAKLAKRKNGEPALINACPVCRGIVIERVASSGRRDRQTFTLAGRALVPLPLRGAATIRIVNELPCKK